MLVLGSVLLTDSTEICLFRFTSLGWSQILAKINDGDVCLLLLSIYRSQGKPVPAVVPPCYVSGSSSELRSPTNNNTMAFYAESTCTWELCSGGGDLLNVHPGHSIGPRKLWNAGALTCVIHPYLLVSFTYNEFLFNLHLFPDDGEPEVAPLLPDCDCTASRYPSRTCQVCDCALRITCSYESAFA